MIFASQQLILEFPSLNSPATLSKAFEKSVSSTTFRIVAENASIIIALYRDVCHQQHSQQLCQLFHILKEFNSRRRTVSYAIPRSHQLP